MPATSPPNKTEYGARKPGARKPGARKPSSRRSGSRKPSKTENEAPKVKDRIRDRGIAIGGARAGLGVATTPHSLRAYPEAPGCKPPLRWWIYRWLR